MIDPQRLIMKLFNAGWPVGSRVWYRERSGEMAEVVTRSEAWLLGGTAVVELNGRVDYARLDRVEVKGPATAERHRAALERLAHFGAHTDFSHGQVREIARQALEWENS